MRSLRKSATSGRLRLFFLGGNLTDRSFTSLLSLSSETILTTELRVSVSKEPHSGPAPPQLLNKSEAEKHHKANDCSFLSSFIVAHDVAPLPQQRLLLLAFVLRKVSCHCSICGVPAKSSI